MTRMELDHSDVGARAATPKAAWRGDLVARGAWFEPVFVWITRTAAFAVMLALAGVCAVLAWDSYPALRAFGPSFLTSEAWNPVTEQFGALAPIHGTIVTSIIAMLVGAPLALGAAIFLTELCPYRLRPILNTAVELLAAVPSIIYGMWGLFVFAPFMAKHVQPLLTNHLGGLPLAGVLFQGAPYGIGVLTAGLILGLMILPFIASVSRQVFATLPPVLREAAYGVGANTWEFSLRVLIPHSRVGLVGAVMLGLGRALGETMAVTFVIGNAHRVSASLLAPGTTISSTLANEFTEAVGDLYLSSLLALGLILFFITFAVLLAARFILGRYNKRTAP